MKSLRNFLYVIILATFACIGYYLILVPGAIAPFINSILIFVLPLFLGLYLVRRLRVKWRLFGIGALTFIGAQVLQLPFKNWTLTPILEAMNLSAGSPPGSMELILFSLMVGLSASVIEETARFVVYRRWLTDVKEWRQGLMFGAGHGGVEAILVGIFILLNFMYMLTLREDPSLLVPAEQLQATQSALDLFWYSPWYIHLLPALERFSALITHMSLSLLVLQAITRSNILWYFGAILWHMLFNAVGVYTLAVWGPTTAEAAILLMAGLSLGIIYVLRGDEEVPPPEDGELQPPPPPPELSTAPVSVNDEKLEESRYD